MFDNFISEMEDKIVQMFDDFNSDENGIDAAINNLKAPSSTWTYLINDTIDSNSLGIQLIGNAGLSAWAGFLWPITFAAILLEKIQKEEIDTVVYFQYLLTGYIIFNY